VTISIVLYALALVAGVITELIAEGRENKSNQER